MRCDAIYYLSLSKLSDNIPCLYFWKQKCSSCLTPKIMMIHEVLTFNLPSSKRVLSYKGDDSGFLRFVLKKSNRETNRVLSNKNHAFVKGKKKKRSQVNNGKYLWGEKKNMSILRKYAFNWHCGASWGGWFDAAFAFHNVSIVAGALICATTTNIS